MNIQRHCFLSATLFLIFATIVTASGYEKKPYISFQNGKGYFPVSVSGRSTDLFASAGEYPGVLRALEDLQSDIHRVSNASPKLFTEQRPSGKEVIIVGTIGKSALIDTLIRNKKLDVKDVAGKWETFLIQVIEEPFPGTERALVIAGSDKRGTIFGIYDLSRQMGVSPWYWWADVPVKKQQEVYVIPGRYSDGEPAVKYRGIFINDEQPALGGWVRENYGGFNHQFYEKVFELILRMKGNFLWPAMWGQSFYTDDPLNPKLADEYGVVISTSHHEPMMRAHAEWQREKGGAWDYTTNDSTLRAFWREGIRRMDDHESIVTLAMRGDGDKPMSEESNVKLLQRIVADQRKILAETTGKDVTSIPQVWALYKEVQDYYDKGMRVPDDVTLLLCDDNWGNIRKLPKLEEAPRGGGYGIYYHFDYVGGPRNYKWLNTNPLPRIWEQMDLAYRYGADRIWIVNVGDIKPMEFPIQFFLDYAWNPEQISENDIDNYTKDFAREQFGDEHAAGIAHLLSAYAKYNSRRKPELLAPDTYSDVHYREAERIVNEYNRLAEEADSIGKLLQPEYKDAYYQLVLYPIKACANLNEMKVLTGRNYRYAKQGRALTNDIATRVQDLFAKDTVLSGYYNHSMAGGKWNHIMDQTHISYTYWQEPRKDVVPEVKTITLPDAAEMGIAIEGSESWWPGETDEAVLPEFDNYNRRHYYIEIFNRGSTSFDYKARPSVPWLKVSASKGKVDKQQRIIVSVDWEKIPAGKQRASITISGAGKKVNVYAVVRNEKSIPGLKGFVEGNGYVSIEAAHYSTAVNSEGVQWKIIPDLGRTQSGITTFPVTAKPELPSEKSPRLEYAIHLSDSGNIKILTYISPTIDFHNAGGLRYAISLDDDVPQVVNIHADDSNRAWARSVADNIILSASIHVVKKPGAHTLKFWRVDPAVVLQKIVIDTGGLKPSYLGPPESFHQ